MPVLEEGFRTVMTRGCSVSGLVPQDQTHPGEAEVEERGDAFPDWLLRDCQSLEWSVVEGGTAWLPRACQVLQKPGIQEVGTASLTCLTMACHC